MKIAYNGAVVSAADARISAFDHGFLYGMGLFETFRTYGGKPYLLERHLRRLADGCRELRIRYVPDAQRLAVLIRRTAEANGLQGDAYVRLTVSAGDGGLGLPAADYEAPQEIVMVKPLPPAAPLLYDQGRELRLLRTPRNTPELAMRLKSLHYMNNIAAKRELADADAAPGAEGLMRTADGWLAEGIVSNLFFAAGGEVRTPSLDTGILAGITRERVIELAQDAGYPVREGRWSWEELLAAEEVWTTNSVQELVPVTTLAGLDGKLASPRAGRAAGPIVRELLERYRADAGSPG
ncbi:4-amino-4-deoxychorismate lyase [Paenibacillus albicereus]|uniref:4-amino-4-deoxychorismate lyase n=1 Tax=Paenibacillus albicereus TaxID=2726185 RepID=A0A6H2GS62_9BACL|nr:aminotransferase class IV [Paenibacillus albicereus]QJC50237.1 4-amino-4-deoxychorismate lyase [Paenibacillus albicereus]